MILAENVGFGAATNVQSLKCWYSLFKVSEFKASMEPGLTEMIEANVSRKGRWCTHPSLLSTCTTVSLMLSELLLLFTEHKSGYTLSSMFRFRSTTSVESVKSLCRTYLLDTNWDETKRKGVQKNKQIYGGSRKNNSRFAVTKPYICTKSRKESFKHLWPSLCSIPARSFQIQHLQN